ncbi:MAG: hypothetical protein WC249_03985 [Patescibacteria group bacterium]|jgi:hypothetical protein
MFFSVFLIIIVAALLSFTVAQFFNVMVRGLPPFLSTKDSIITKAIEGVSLNSEDVVYELGCGRAKFLRSLYKKFSGTKYVGMEYSFLPYLLVRLELWLTNSRIKIIKNNFFKISLDDATLIYFYLLPEIMTRMGQKIKNECRPGTRIISYQFSLPGLRPEKIIINKNDRLYFYQV